MNISVCPLIDSGEGYGNIHKENIINALNSFQDNFVYKLHSENKLYDYLKYYDQSVFGNRYDHLCSVRAVLTTIAKEINNNNTKNISEIIKETAQKTGFGA